MQRHGQPAHFAEGFYLTAAFMERPRTTTSPAATPGPARLGAEREIPDGLAPAYLCTAGFDPLRDEGDAYAEKLQEAGVKVEHERFGDHIHGFVNVLAVEGPRRPTCAASPPPSAPASPDGGVG